MAKFYKDWIMQYKAIPVSGKSLQRLDDATQSYTYFMAKVYKDWVIEHKSIPNSWQKYYDTYFCAATNDFGSGGGITRTMAGSSASWPSEVLT